MPSQISSDGFNTLSIKRWNGSSYDTPMTFNSSNGIDIVGNTSVSGTLTANSIAVTSNTVVTNLNADTLDGNHASAFAAQKGTDTVYGGAKFSLNGTTLIITTT